MNINFIKRAFEKRTILTVIICGIIFSMVIWYICYLVNWYKFNIEVYEL